MLNGRVVVVFVDSNIWSYAFLTQDANKLERALELVNRAMTEDGFCISTQVVSECINVLFKKGGYDVPRIFGCVNRMEQTKVIAVTTAIARRAVEIKALYGLQFYDAQIVAAAESAGCSELWSEDMGDGQTYCGVRCINPFETKTGEEMKP